MAGECCSQKRKCICLVVVVGSVTKLLVNVWSHNTSVSTTLCHLRVSSVRSKLQVLKNVNFALVQSSQEVTRKAELTFPPLSANEDNVAFTQVYILGVTLLLQAGYEKEDNVNFTLVQSKNLPREIVSLDSEKKGYQLLCFSRLGMCMEMMSPSH